MHYLLQLLHATGVTMYNERNAGSISMVLCIDAEKVHIGAFEPIEASVWLPSAGEGITRTQTRHDTRAMPCCH